MIEFEWDENKAKSNLIKHGISFEFCKSAFYDKAGIYVFDEKHSQDENRFILLGKTKEDIVVVISYTIRNNSFRIISCRVANKSERKLYEEE